MGKERNQVYDITRINLIENKNRLTEYAKADISDSPANSSQSDSGILHQSDPAVNPQQQTAPVAEIQTDDSGSSYSLPETDNQYQQAIESKDLDTARQLVDQAAFGSTQMTSALAESTDENVRTLLSALTSVAPRLAQLRSGVQEGTRYDVGINDIIAQAAEK